MSVLVFLWDWGKSGKLGQNTKTHGHIYTEGHPKCQISHIDIFINTISIFEDL